MLFSYLCSFFSLRFLCEKRKMMAYGHKRKGIQMREWYKSNCRSLLLHVWLGNIDTQYCGCIYTAYSILIYIDTCTIYIAIKYESIYRKIGWHFRLVAAVLHREWSSQAFTVILSTSVVDVCDMPNHFHFLQQQNVREEFLKRRLYYMLQGYLLSINNVGWITEMR